MSERIIKPTNGAITSTSDAAKSFAGQVVVGSGDGSTGVSGSISVATSDRLQSNQNGDGTEEEPEEDPETGV